MCAITGVYAPDGKAALYARELLHFQQNRGQDTSGIYTVHQGQVSWRKGEGLVREVFGTLILPKAAVRGNVRKIDKLKDNFAVGQNRYKTVGDGGPDNAQPFMTENERYIVILSHNGHVNNYQEIAQQLNLEQRMQQDTRVGGNILDPGLEKKSDCDVVPIMYVFADGLLKHNDAIEGILQGAQDVMEMIRGAYTISSIVHDKKTNDTYLVAFKDPRGIRPGFFGKNNGSYAIASETGALEETGFWNIAPILNAEVLIIGEKGVASGEGIIRKRIPKFAGMPYVPCQFEEGYFSQGLSVLNGRSINHGRYLEGFALGRKLKRERPEWLDIIQFITPMPFTPIPIAKGVAEEVDKRFKICIEKDKYNYKREFITESRKRHKRKFRVHWDAVCGKSFAVTEDSIVRGETMLKAIADLREAGAEHIILLSGYDHVRHRCDLGIDMRTYGELVAHGRTDDEIAKYIGADGILYLSQEEYADVWNNVDLDAGLKRKLEKGIFSSEILTFVSRERCNACVTGKNPTHD